MEKEPLYNRLSEDDVSSDNDTEPRDFDMRTPDPWRRRFFVSLICFLVILVACIITMASLLMHPVHAKNTEVIPRPYCEYSKLASTSSIDTRNSSCR